MELCGNAVIAAILPPRSGRVGAQGDLLVVSQNVLTLV